MEGILNILKPPGMTSHDVVARMRRLTGQKKIGHSGTLDPGAAGVLPVFLGKATRLIEYGMEWDKTYRVELTLGGESETGDDFSEIHWSPVDKYPTEETICRVLAGFLGPQLQIPPMYSALKVNGKKLYDLARAGQTVEREARQIEIYSIQLLSYAAPIIRFDVSCSKGTYIRTLCEDIARAMDLSGVMTFLLRTQVGAFSVKTSELPNETIEWGQKLIPKDYAVAHLNRIELTDEESVQFIQGQKLLITDSFEGIFRIQNRHLLLGIGRVQNQILKPAKVLVSLDSLNID